MKDPSEPSWVSKEQRNIEKAIADEVWYFKRALLPWHERRSLFCGGTFPDLPIRIGNICVAHQSHIELGIQPVFGADRLTPQTEDAPTILRFDQPVGSNETVSAKPS